MNDYDTEFVAEDESVISTNIIRKEEVIDQSSSVSVPGASIYILSTQNKDETDTLGQDEPNSAPATHCTSNQSPSPAIQRTSNQSSSPTKQRTANQSPAAATKHTADQSPLLLLLDILPFSHPNLLFLLWLPYPKTPGNGSKAQ